jgi:transposase
MSRSSQLLDTEVVMLAKSYLKCLGKDVLVARKLEAIIAASKHGISAVAKIYDISRTTLTEWIKHLKSGNFDKLKAPPERKRKSILNASDRAAIQGWVVQDPQVTIKYLVQKIEDVLQKKISKSTVHREVRNMKYSYITPRKLHVKQDANLVTEFKKNIAKKASDMNVDAIMFFDESRFGTHSKIGHGWFKRGSRTPVKIKLCYRKLLLILSYKSRGWVYV